MLQPKRARQRTALNPGESIRLRNKYEAPCKRCGGWVVRGEGWATKSGHLRWRITHERCPQPRMKNPSPPRRQLPEGILGYPLSEPLEEEKCQDIGPLIRGN